MVFHVGRHRTFDMEEAVASATTLFWRGYDRTSLTDLTGALGIAPASFYFAFGSKEALFRQVVDRYVAFQAKAFERAFQAPTTAAGVEALLRGYIDVVTDPGHVPGCLVVNSGPAADGDALARWLALHRDNLRARLEARFDADRAAGKLADGADPAAMARFVVTLAGGIALESRAGASRPELHDAVGLALQGFPAKAQKPRITSSQRRPA